MKLWLCSNECNETVVTRDKICICIYDDMNQDLTPLSASYYLM